ncbi:hypothetical protein OG689_19985 [Kitasatospora sp. NBC_00240]|uniref:hypothetical protein n=1 Tax=Kitasatospora sp. NBC_00240 TaxID=2903567 RepID=UPI00225975FF|nr:hypothetical protein [Kitasatospora sp. NBC_00240]MCX5211540.1 hypothetical protein [Kitasatospora sp. NBC_00240]
MNGSRGTDGRPGGSDDPEGLDGPDSGEPLVARELAGLAEGLEIGPVPYERVLAGGRARRRRRGLAAVVATALATAVVVGAGAVLAGTGPGTGAPAVAAAPAGTGTPVVTPAAAAPAGRDPLTPVRAVVGQGRTAGGQEWQAWVAIWPAVATREQARGQLDRIWEERHAVIPQLPEEDDAYAEQRLRSGTDQANLYLTVDGRRAVDDTVHDVPPPTAGPLPATDRSHGLDGALLGFKGGELGHTPVLVASVGPDVATVRVTWSDGTSTEVAPVTVAGSAPHWFAVPRRAGAEADAIRLYGADGALLHTSTDWMR